MNCILDFCLENIPNIQLLPAVLIVIQDRTAYLDPSDFVHMYRSVRVSSNKT